MSGRYYQAVFRGSSLEFPGSLPLELIGWIGRGEPGPRRTLGRGHDREKRRRNKLRRQAIRAQRGRKRS